jgi:predicted transcriptional regulator
MRKIDDLENEMRAVARGERKPSLRPEPRTVTVFNTLTPANLKLLRVIAIERPSTVSQLAKLTDRKQSNVSRTLQDLSKLGIVRMVRHGREIRPEIISPHLHLNVVEGTWSVSQEENRDVAISG